MNILILNWRDTKHPEHGGAEILTHEIAKKWVQWGHSVTQLSSRFTGSLARERVDGVTIIRRGSATIRTIHIPVHLAAYFWYRYESHEDYDVVIDEIHGIPFFSTLYVHKPVVALICEVAGGLWDMTFPFPTNTIGKFIERHYHIFYTATQFLTISRSTEKELVALGVPSSRVTVLPMGVTVQRIFKIPKKEVRPTLIYVGRLTRAKGVEDAIDVADAVRRQIPNVQLWVVGQGDASYVRSIQTIITQKNLTNIVHLFGFVNEKDKYDYLARAHILIAPSYKEGWGLTIPEAGSVGTPAVAYDVSGLRDIVRPHTGASLVHANPSAMSPRVIALLKARGGALYARYQREAHSSAQTYSWDKTATKALQVLKEVTRARSEAQ